MRKLVLICLVSGIATISGNAQSLFTYGSHSVNKDEFLRVYKKNSINKEVDMSDTALKSYLNLYSLFRMKVAEAEKEKLDTLSNIQKELDNYRRTLAKNYLTDEQVTNKLIHEAYDRMKTDVRVAHILISCPPGSDTVAASKKIDSIYQVINTNKASFETMAATFSEDKGSKDNGGDIGYFSGMQTVYSFENVAFNTTVGKVSKPFRTQFGYHILKVLDKRDDPGQVKVAQIMIAVAKSKGEEAVEAGRKRADSVVAMLKQGKTFEELVKTYSDDQYSSKDGGVMKPFGMGRMTPAFEKAAFGLKRPGDISEPIKTDYGWHIIKLIAKIPLEPYDTIFSQLKHKVENDSRSQTARDHFFNKIKEKNGFKEYAENIREISAKLTAIPDTGKDAKVVKAANYSNMVKPVFTLAGKTYLQIDFARFFEGLTHGKINGPHSAVVHDGYTMYVNNVVNDFEEHKLVEENVEFKNLMEEYKDGIMLFELMDRNVWGKASHDSEGLKAFFETRKNKYTWEPGFEGSIYKFKNKTAFDTGMKLLLDKSNTDETVVKRINTQSLPDGVTIQRGRFEFSHFKDATMAELEKNSTKVIYPAAGTTTYTVVVSKELHKTSNQKTLEEARGYVVAEYQDFLEKQWNDKMKKDYPMKVNESVLSALSKEKVSNKSEEKSKKTKK